MGRTIPQIPIREPYNKNFTSGVLIAVTMKNSSRYNDM
jgi:hypothetical protein